MDQETIKIVIIIIIVIVGLNMLLDTILEDRNANADFNLLNMKMKKDSTKILKETNDDNFTSKLVSKSKNGTKLLVNPQIKDLSNKNPTLNLAEITRLLCNKQDENVLELHSDSNKTISEVYHDLESTNSDFFYKDGIHSSNYYDNKSYAYEASLNDRLRDTNEKNIQENLIMEQFHGKMPKFEYPVGNHFSDLTGERPDPPYHSIRGGGDLRDYYSENSKETSLRDPNIRAPPTGNSAPTMQRRSTNSSEAAPWQENLETTRVYKVDNWMYDNEKVMNGGKFGILSPFDTFGSDFACV